tara:strand:+ start:98 stop:328 length:231 start_codon:yes stop_codon:yes gene_type:complete
MKPLNEELTEEFIERLVDQSVGRLENTIRELDISLDYIASLLSGRTSIEIRGRQKSMGRMAPHTDVAVGRDRGSKE